MRMLVFAAVIPAAICLWIVYRLDRHREPPSFVLQLCFAGAVAVLPAGLAEHYLLNAYASTPEAQWPFLALLITAFGVAGITEETIKGVFFQRLVLHKRTFSEPYDGVVYAVAIGVGFAALENILYVTSDGLSTAFVRAFTAVPAHTLFGVVMGSLFAAHKFYGASLFPAYAVPALLHGLYDTFAMADSLLANALLVVFLMGLVWYAFRKAGPLLRKRTEVGVT